MTPLDLPERWILARLQTVIADARTVLRSLPFQRRGPGALSVHLARVCDWYLELSKLALTDGAPGARARVQSVLVGVLEQALRLLHPFMPFITEAIWQALPITRPAESVMLARYPVADPARQDAEAEARIAQLIEAVRSIRNIRAELGIPPAATVTIHVDTDGRGAHVAPTSRRRFPLCKSRG